MKKTLSKCLIGISLLLFATANIFAQTDRSKAPSAQKPAPVKIAKPEFFELANGMKIYFVRETKAPSVSFSIAFDLPPVLEKEKAGIGDMTASILRRGTKKRTKNQIDEELDFVGASLSVNDGYIFGSALTKHKETLFEIASDVVMNPSFPEDELEKIKKQTLSGLKSSKSSADAIATRVSGKLFFGANHPFGEITSEETVQSITAEDCKKFYARRFMPNAVYMSIVGDLTLPEAKKLAEKYFASWKKGTPEKSEVPAVKQPASPQVALIQKDAAVQSVIKIGYAVDYKMNSKDYIAAMLLNQMLGGGGFSNRLIQNIREDKGYTYGAGSSLQANRYGGRFTAGASVRTAVTDSAVFEFLKEMKLLREQKVSDEELRLHKNIATGSFARSLESSQTISRFAITAAREGLPSDFYENYLKNIEAVTAEDIQNMAKKYLLPENCYIVVVGELSEIRNKMTRFGKVTEYDDMGNEVKPSDFKAGDLNAETVFANYINAVGGKDKLASVKSLEIFATQSMQGMAIETISKKQNNTHYATIIKLPMGMGENKVVMAGDKGKMKSPMGNKDFTAEEIAGMSAEAQLFFELTYDKIGAKIELTGNKTINGANAHEVTVTMSNGRKSKRYYDEKTFLLVSKSDEGGTTIYGDYKEFDGIKFPSKGTLQTPRGDLSVEFTKVVVNGNIDEKEFDLNF
jgi:predicted Zn-dependent peptidase